MRFSLGETEGVRKLGDTPSAVNSDVDDNTFIDILGRHNDIPLPVQELTDEKLDLLRDLAKSIEHRLANKTRYVGGLPTRFEKAGYAHINDICTILDRNPVDIISLIGELKQLGVLESPKEEKWDLLVAFLNIRFTEHSSYLRLTDAGEALL